MKSFIKILLCSVGLSCVGSYSALAQKPITANFMANNVCDGEEVIFANLSKVADSLTPFDVLWRFGDGQESQDYNPKHLYKLESFGVTQSFYLKLIIRSTYHPEFADSLAKTVTINAPSDPNFRYVDSGGDGKGNNVFKIYHQATTDYTNTYYWNFCDIQTSRKVTPVFTFSIVELKTPCNIRLTILNNAGCTSEHTEIVDIYRLGIDMEEVVGTQSIGIFPNPSSGLLNLPQDVQTLLIYNAFGQVVLDISNPAQQLETNLSSGWYNVIITTNAGSSSQPLIIQ